MTKLDPEKEGERECVEGGREEEEEGFKVLN